MELLIQTKKLKAGREAGGGRPPVLRDDVDLKGALIKTGNLLTINNFPNSRFLIEFLPGISSKCHPVVAFPPAPAFKT